MERWKYWWNGLDGPAERCDVRLYCDGGTWWIEVRTGAADGRSYWREYPDADAALDRVRELLAGLGSWREMR